MNSVLHKYGEEFNSSSADIIVPYLNKIFQPSSVVDVGCGIGTWLSSFLKYENIDILGIDGEHVLDSNQLLISNENFLSCDLTKFKFADVNKIFDLALCLEVAEHLEEKYASSFIKELCSLSKVIIFSAAIPGQTGENHFNEQYPDYWQKIFAKNDFVFLDPFRSMFWMNLEVEWWYRQNLYLVVHKDLVLKYEFPRWNGEVYIINDLFDMYVNHLQSKNSDALSVVHNIDSYSTRKIIKHLFKKGLNKITFGLC